ncbi:hypothetical protein VTO42DRAFT_5140 [Malbranchea cinnamomea]
MMDRQTLQDRIYAAFRDRNLPCVRQDLEMALQDPAQAQWAIDNLRSDTLLSKEEAQLYSNLMSSPSFNNILQSPNLLSTRPFLDDEIATAIESLKNSTAAIEAQTEVLQAQYKELRAILQEEDQNLRRRETVLERFNGKNADEARKVYGAVEELSSDLVARLDKTLVMLEAENNVLVPRVSNMLKEHDNIFYEFEELASRLEEDEDDDLLEKRATNLSVQLGRLMAEEISCRLDRLYFESISEGQNQTHSERDEAGDQAEQLASLEEEINSLYSEIDVLAQMAAQQNFQSKVSQALRRKRETAGSLSLKQLDRILNCITQLTTSIEQLNERVETRHSHRLAVNSLAMLARHIMRERQLTKPARPKHLTRHSMSSLDMHRESGHKRSASSQNLSYPELETLLRRFNISLPALLKSANPEISAIGILEEKKETMLQVLQDCYSAAVTPLLPYLDAAEKTAQSLGSSLHSNPTFPNSGGHENGERWQRLGKLEEELQALEERIEGLDFNTDSLRRDPDKERFLERWG